MADKPAAPAADKGPAPAKKTNPQVEVLIKNQFWILGAIALVTAGVVWWMGAGDLDKQFATDKRLVDMKFTEVRNLEMKQGTQNALPSEFFTKSVNDLRKQLGEQVVAAWDNLYDRQTDTSEDDATEIFVVDKDIDNLTKNTQVATFRELILHEPDDREAMLKADSSLGPDILQKIQVYHSNRILDKEIAGLFGMLDLRHAREKDIFGKQLPVAAGAAPEKGVEGILVWAAPVSPAGFLARYTTTQPPSLDRIAMTYEDIWTFRSVFTALRKINSRPIDTWLDVMKGKSLSAEAASLRVDQANVPIKRIDYCDLAQWAMYSSFEDPGDVKIVAPGSSGGGIDPVINSGGSGGSTFSVNTQGTEEETKQLMTGRYLNGRNEQVENPSDPPFAEFRQMYVQIKVLMDQRLIPVLIAECANAPLPIETRQVRVTLDEVDVIRKAAANVNDPTSLQRSPHDAVVMLRGVVYIYTIPDDEKTPDEKRKLGKGSDPEPSKREYGTPKKASAPAL